MTIRLTSLALALFATLPAAQTISTFPYFEDFEAGDGAFVVGGSAPSWAWGSPANAPIDSAASGTSAWVTNLAGPHNAQEASWIEAPEFDFTGLASDPVLAFRRIAEFGSSTISLVQLSLDGGAFTSLTDSSDPARVGWYPGGFNTAWSESSGPPYDWQLARHTLTGAAGRMARVRFFFQSQTTFPFYAGTGIDDVLVFVDRVDAAVEAVLAPLEVGPPTTTAPITVRLVNRGTVELVNVDLRYVITGPVSATVTETFAGPLPAYGSVEYTFASAPDLSLVGDYDVDVEALLPGDEDAANDVLRVSTRRRAEVASFPYLEDLEADDGDFLAIGRPSSWEHGPTPAALLNGAESGLASWNTSLAGSPEPYELSALYLPPLDLRSMTNDPMLVVEMRRAFDGRLIAELSLDEGPFQPIGTSPGAPDRYDPSAMDWYLPSQQGWGGFTTSWRRAKHLVTGAAGHRAVVRLRFTSEGPTTLHGIAVDSVEVFEAPFGAGQPSRPGTAVLEINGSEEVLGYSVEYGKPGPYFAAVSVASDLFELIITAAPNQIVWLYGGQVFPGAFTLPGIGQADLAPAFLLAAGTETTGLGPFFVTNSLGAMQFVVGVPASLAGSSTSYQALVGTPAPGLALSNAVTVTFTP